MQTSYEFSGSHYEEPVYKRLTYYGLLFLIGFVPGLVTGYILWH